MARRFGSAMISKTDSMGVVCLYTYIRVKAYCNFFLGLARLLVAESFSGAAVPCDVHAIRKAIRSGCSKNRLYVCIGVPHPLNWESAVFDSALRLERPRENIIHCVKLPLQIECARNSRGI